MTVSISSKMVDKYPLIETACKVDIDEYNVLQERGYNEIIKYD